MTDGKNVDKRRQILRARGIPEKFVEALATRKDSVANFAYVLIPVALILVMCLSATVWLKPVFALFARVLYGHVRPALLIGALPVGLAAVLVCLMLLVILTAITVVTLASGPAKPWPAYSATASVLRGLGRGETVTSVRRREAYVSLSYLSDDTAFLNAVIQRGRRATARLPLIAGAALALACLFASQSYWRLTEDAFEVHRPWSDHIYPLTSVTGTEVSCGPEGRSADVFKYRLVFPQGRFDIVEGQSMTQPEVSWQETIARVGRIHQQLVDRKLPVRLFRRRGETAVQFSACLARWRADTGVKAGFPEAEIGD